ncbi:threonine aldolase [Paenibacillus swuensis]|uniref:Threonine aldolase n=1 Tax=Paenibacillus swuensis TaxID=1178515 RepID=A0A172TMC9_9BACL|nr:beta-eliminating lyase-related protein [Paenibacillus swuensis]ANE48229.1 threonine aldolase [Paenibacillus swuensis]
MQESLTLKEAYKLTPYLLNGHGPRDVQVLMDALSSYPGNMESDIYGTGELIEHFQTEMATMLGKESAVFFPSGTMAQQIALRLWCDEKGWRRVAYHPLAHPEIHEEDCLRELHQIETVLLGEPDRLIRLEDIKQMKADISCVLLELPQREIGGQLPTYEELEAISKYCRELGIKLHMDGARLFEVLPHYKKTAAEVCQLFDSVYISFYKGIGGVAGAILAGDLSFTEKTKVWKRRLGGDLISLYPYILSAEYYIKQRLPKMDEYYEQSRELAALYNACSGLTTVPYVPVSNMFHVHAAIPAEKLEPELIALYEQTGIGLTSYLTGNNGNSTCSFEVNIGDRYTKISKESVKKAFDLLHQRLVALT